MDGYYGYRVIFVGALKRATDIEIAVIVIAEAGGNTWSISLLLRAGDTGLDTLDESAAFFFGDGPVTQ